MNNSFSVKPGVQPRNIKLLLGDFLFHIRERKGRLTREQVAGHTEISVRTLNNLEKTSFASGDLILRVFHYYVFCGHVTPAEERLFSYLFNLMRRKK